jgi:DNA uptake protein ComE-like DNA-binding protein
MKYVNVKFKNQRSGIALFFTVIALVLLTALVYGLCFGISQWKHRMQYMVDYQNARYACESGLKYALSSMEELDVNYISRPNEPDFSDLFTMSDADYKQMMREWAYTLATQMDANTQAMFDFSSSRVDLSNLDPNNVVTDINNIADSNYFNFDANDSNAQTDVYDMNDPNGMYVRGPYGPKWPLVTKPMEIEFGNAKLTVEIIDENAKLPLVWAINSDANTQEESAAAVVTFCEWMQMNQSQIDTITNELAQIKEIKPFTMAPVKDVNSAKPGTDANSQQTAASGRAARRIARLRQRGRIKEKVVTQTRTASSNTLDFAKIFHSPMIDLDMLAKPVNQDETRVESALKYASLWGTQRVNINTAPRHVLEAAFTFGGDAADIAQKIIDERRLKPFTSIDDLKKRLMAFNSSIIKTEPFITTTSDCYSIRVKAVSGVARVCATAGVKKEGQKVERIGIIIE